MATVIQPRRTITAEVFLEMDLGAGSQELVRGEIIAWPPGTSLHGRICVTDDTAVITGRNPDTVRGADVIAFSHARHPLSAPSDAACQVAPDLVVEVLSPSSPAAVVLEKVHEYLDSGIMLVWVVNPEGRTVAIHRPDDPIPTVYRDTNTIEDLPQLPGFLCAVSGFFI
jgi:Uma2 family endonuclease